MVLGFYTGNTRLILFILISLQLMVLTNGIADDDDDDDEDDFEDDYENEAEELNYYGTDNNDAEEQYYDDEYEFGYGDVYTFDEEQSSNKLTNKQQAGDAMSSNKDAQGGIHFHSNNIVPVLSKELADRGDHAHLQDDHKEYNVNDRHPGAGTHNGHEHMDKTHTGLLHDERGASPVLQYDEDNAHGTQRIGRPQKQIYESDFNTDHANHIPAGFHESKPKSKGYEHMENDDSYYPAKPKPRQPSFGSDFDSGPLVSSSHEAAVPVIPKPPFVRAVPVNQDEFDAQFQANPAYYESEERGDGLHFSSSYKTKVDEFSDNNAPNFEHHDSDVNGSDL